MDQTSPGKITLSILATVSFSILAWDHCLFITAEYEVLQRIGQRWKNPRHWMFILLRYAGLAALFSNMFFSTIRHKNCHSASAAHETFYLFSMIAFCTLISLRVANMWKYHPDVVSLLGILSLIVIGLWVAVATQVKPFSQSNTLLGPTCSLQPFPAWFSATYAAALVFNLAAFSFAAAHVFAKARDMESDLRQGFRLLIFLIICIAAAAAILVISALGTNQQASKEAASPFFILIMVSMGSRIYLTFAPEELDGPIFVSFGRSYNTEITDASWQIPSTINQSGIRSIPNSSTTKQTTLASMTRSGSLATSESHMQPLGASLSPPSPRPYKPSLPTISSLQPSGSSPATENVGSHLNTSKPKTKSGEPGSTASTTLRTTPPPTTTMPKPHRVHRPLPVPPPISEHNNQGISTGDRDNQFAPTENTRKKRRKKLSDSQSGWVD